MTLEPEVLVVGGTATGVVSVDPGSYLLEVKPDSEVDDNPFDAEFIVKHTREFLDDLSGERRPAGTE